MHPIRIDVTARSGRYPIVIEPGAAARLGSILDAHDINRRRWIVSTPRVWKAQGRTFTAGLGGPAPILVPDGERFKTLATTSRIYDALVDGRADRGSVVIGVGGGVLGDAAGFAAATFLRGLSMVHAPTTLLAQVDSSIGGKVGVNHPRGKNLIGAFHAPALVVIDPETLGTLPPRELQSGLYEVVKYGVIASADLFARVERDLDRLLARETAALTPVIAECCRIKADVVSKDEREGGLRRILNFGHTVGHALEAATQYRRVTHGEAVGYGMLAVLEVARARGTMPADECDRVTRLIHRLGPAPDVSDVKSAALRDAMRLDKKVLDGALHVVLPDRIGSVSIVSDVTMRDLSAAARIRFRRPLGRA